MRKGKFFPLFRDNLIGAGAGFNSSMPRRMYLRPVVSYLGVPVYPSPRITEEGFWVRPPGTLGIVWAHNFTFALMDWRAAIVMGFSSTATVWATLNFHLTNLTLGETCGADYELLQTGWEYPPLFDTWLMDHVSSPPPFTFFGVVQTFPVLYGDLPPPWPA